MFTSKVYEEGSVGAVRCEKIVNAILSDIKGERVYNHVPRKFKSYITYSDVNGWLEVTVYAKNDGGRLYTVMRQDNKRGKVTVLDIRIKDNGRHFASTHTWDI